MSQESKGLFSYEVSIVNLFPYNLNGGFGKDEQLYRRSMDYRTRYKLEIDVLGNQAAEYKKLAEELEAFLRERGFHSKLFA